MRCRISHVPTRDGAALPTKPTAANNALAATNNPKLVTIPASDTMMSPLRKFRYLRGVTGTGLAAPKVKLPFEANHKKSGNTRVMNGSMCFRGLRGSRPVGSFGVGVFVGHNREWQDRGPDEDFERNSSGSRGR